MSKREVTYKLVTKVSPLDYRKVAFLLQEASCSISKTGRCSRIATSWTVEINGLDSHENIVAAKVILDRYKIGEIRLEVHVVKVLQL